MNSASSVPQCVRHTAGQATWVNDLPKELIAVAAYRRWCLRCAEAGREIHGHDQEDWFAAEAEIREAINMLSGSDFEVFAKRIRREQLQPSEDRVRLRAYYLSLDSDDVEQNCWLRALDIEREIVFARLFIEFCDSRFRLSLFPRVID